MNKLRNKIEEGLNEYTAKDLGDTIGQMKQVVNRELPDMEPEEVEDVVGSAISMGGDNAQKNTTMTQTNLGEAMDNFDMVAHDIAKTIYPDNDLMYGYMEKYIANNKDIIANVARELANMGGNVEHVKNHPIVKKEMVKNSELAKLLDYPELLSKIKPLDEYDDGNVSRGIEGSMNPESGEINYEELNQLIQDINNMNSGDMNPVDFDDHERDSRGIEHGGDIYENVNPRMTKKELIESVLGKTTKKKNVIKTVKVKDIKNGK
jgi:hypothetical protein